MPEPHSLGSALGVIIYLSPRSCLEVHSGNVLEREHLVMVKRRARRAGIVTGLDAGAEGGRERPAQKPSMVIMLRKSPQFDEQMAAAAVRQQSEGRDHRFFGGRGDDNENGDDDDEPPQIPVNLLGGARMEGPSRSGSNPGPSRA